MGRNDKRKYQRNCALSFKRNRTQWNKRKDKTMTLDTKVNPAESGKGFFYIQREGLEEYEYGKDMFYGEYGDDKNYTLNTIPTAYSCRIVFLFFPFFSDLLLLLLGYEKRH